MMAFALFLWCRSRRLTPPEGGARALLQRSDRTLLEIFCIVSPSTPTKKSNREGMLSSVQVLQPTPTMVTPRATPAIMGMRKAGWFPGTNAPTYLDGSLPGDVGFDPMCMVALAPTGTASDSGPWAGADRKTRMVMMTEYERSRKVRWMREAELKHSRLAMLAAAGWPIAELLDGPLSKVAGLPYGLEATGGRAPGLFNGHMFDGPNGAFILASVAFTAYLELNSLDNVEGLTPTDYVAGDFGFDPAGFSEKKDKEQLALAEIKHGRVAMLAVAGFAVQELLYGTPVVMQTPQFFKPFFL